MRLRRRPKPNPALLERHIVMQDGLCWYCGVKMTGHAPADPRAPTLDHKIPLSRGGERRGRNTVAACWHCNSRKGSMTAEEFLASAPKQPAPPVPSRDGRRLPALP